MDKQEYGQLEKNADLLQKNAEIRCSQAIKRAQDYHEGYVQGIRDLMRCIGRNGEK